MSVSRTSITIRQDPFLASDQIAMEAATRLPLNLVRVAGDRLFVDGLVVEDECAVRLAREHEDAARLVTDAIEIGARVLDREQTAANAEFVKLEFERAARELDAEFVERARKVAERLDAKVDEAFGPEAGVVTRALERHFGEESASAVHHQVRAVVAEVMGRSREELVRQFSSGDAGNPLADFKSMAAAMMKQAADRQAEQLRSMDEKLAGMREQIVRLQAEREKLEELEAERERGSAKGRSFEEAVYEALDAIAVGQGDDCDAVGDFREATGKVGDVVVAIDACRGPARGRIVFEAKNARLSKKAALEELDEAIRERNADYAVMVVPRDEKLPARTHPLREHGGDKLFVTYDPEEGSRLALEVAYGLARARVLAAREEGEGIDAGLLRAQVENALTAMEDVRKIKSQLTGATNGIDEARRVLESMAARVRDHLAQIEAVVAAGDSPESDDPAE
jgi:hypothetical protein